VGEGQVASVAHQVVLPVEEDLADLEVALVLVEEEDLELVEEVVLVDLGDLDPQVMLEV